MNTLVIVLIAAVVLVCAYAGYGRWLAKTWGVDPNAKTPAVRLEDGKDYVPTNGWTVFAHQFSSIAGAGPVTGAIQAAAFGWLPVLLWVLIGGMGSILGSILTGLALGVIEGMTKVFYPEASTTVVFVIMVLVLMFRPAGLFGKEK